MTSEAESTTTQDTNLELYENAMTETPEIKISTIEAPDAFAYKSPPVRAPSPKAWNGFQDSSDDDEMGVLKKRVYIFEAFEKDAR